MNDKRRNGTMTFGDAVLVMNHFDNGCFSDKLVYFHYNVLWGSNTSLAYSRPIAEAILLQISECRNKHILHVNESSVLLYKAVLKMPRCNNPSKLI